jgi:ADP-heptose:LPS heptosyltransferase
MLQRRSTSRRFGGWVLDRWATALGNLGGPAGQRTVRPERITVLALWGIGDAIHLTPMLALLKGNHPQAEIELVGPPFLTDLFRTEPCVDKIVSYAPPWTAHSGKYRLWGAEYRSLGRWLRERRRDPSDWLVTTRGDVREHLLAYAMSGRSRFGYGEGAGAAILTHPFPGSAPFARGLHGVEAGVEVARLLGCEGQAAAPRLHLEPAEIDDAGKELAGLRAANGGPLVALHAGASFGIRRWPRERFSAVLQRVRERIGGLAIVADPEGSFRGIEPPSGVPFRILQGGLRRVLALLACTDVLLCSDSGIMHAGAALGNRVVAVFGPTHPGCFAPFGGEHRVVRDARIRCGPCVDRCRMGTPHCMETVGPDRVARALEATCDAWVADPAGEHFRSAEPPLRTGNHHGMSRGE